MEPLAWIVHFLILCGHWKLVYCDFKEHCSTCKEPRLPFGAIFDFDDRESKAGFLFGVAQFNRDRLQQFKLSSNMHQINVRDSYILADSICEQMVKGVFMFFGARRIESSSIVQSYTQTFHVPFVSPSPAENVEPIYPSYQLHMRPKHTRALVELIQHFGWRNFHYVYDSEDGLYSLQSILRGLDKTKHDVQVRMRRLADINNAHEDLRALDKLDENATHRHILLDLSKEVHYLTILKQIREVGMNKVGYHYILGTLDFTNLDMERYQHGGVNITGFQLVNYSTPVVGEFINAWSTMAPNIVTGSSNSSIHIDTALSFDGITVIHMTLAALIKNYTSIFKHTFRRGQVFNNNRTKGVPCDTNPPVPWMHGDALMEGMRQLQFEGLTGNVQFDRYGFRKNYMFGVYHVGLKTGPNKIGEWGPSKLLMYNDDKVIPEKNVSKADKVYVVTSIEPPHITYVRLIGDEQGAFEYGTWNLRRDKNDPKTSLGALSTPHMTSRRPPITSTRKYPNSRRPSISSVYGSERPKEREDENDYMEGEAKGDEDNVNDVDNYPHTQISKDNVHIKSSEVSSGGETAVKSGSFSTCRPVALPLLLCMMVVIRNHVVIQ